MSLDLQKLISSPPPWVMGILNMSPDSFSESQEFPDRSKQLPSLKCADIIDIGAEATSPGTKAIPEAEELNRLKPILDSSLPQGVFSLDTYKSSIAQYALERGVKIINDVSALRADSNMAAVVKDHNAFIVMMYAKGKSCLPHANDEEVEYSDIVRDIAEFLLQRVEHATKLGISEDRIILDPGMGKFISNNPQDSWSLLSRLDELKEMLNPFPILIGCSRKGFLGGSFMTGELYKRDRISQVVSLLALEKGAKIIRTHQPKMAKEFIDLWRRF